MKIKKGEFLTFTEGEYSDYMVNGLVRALCDFDVRESQKRWEVENTKIKTCSHRCRDRKEVTGMEFLPWLVEGGIVEDVEYREIHTGSCGEVDIIQG